VKTASEMTYTVSGGALNSTQSNPLFNSLMCKCQSLLLRGIEIVIMSATPVQLTF